MAWERSTGHDRTSTSTWQSTRRRILERDGRVCHVCGALGADFVDHITPKWRGGTDEDDNLAAIHDVRCHRSKTAREGAEARKAQGKYLSNRRPPERHPGLLPPAE